MDDYNYAHFDEYVRSGRERDEFAAFPSHLHVGDQAPEFTAHRLTDGARVDGSGLWRRAPLVMEFGSFI